MKTANLAIVFTDIKGFTERTSSQTLEENERLLQRHSQLLAPVFKAFGGRIIKMIGDAFMATFESPTNSVLCGVAIQDRLWLYNRTVPERERFEVRVAVNAGEVRLEDNDVFGEPVNIAARVEGIAEAGWVYFTESVYLAMNKAEVPAEEVGQFELKGIPGKVRVYRVPRAPYRVEAPTTAGGAPGAEGQAPVSNTDAMPPYGNIGLAKISDDPSLRDLNVKPNDVAARAAEFGAKAVALGGELGRNLARRKLAVSPKMLGGLGAAIVIVVLIAALSSGGVAGAVRDVKKSAGRDRDAKVELARKKIAELKDEGERKFWTGMLDEARGADGSAVRDYEDAVEAGYKRAERRLIEMLSDERCETRASAASAIGRLHLEKARSELEDLAQSGGNNEGADIPIFGCNSKAAAERALKELDRAK
ncbi:MAG: adenylate/guanylate cyclase domain-containing protein [Myxococcaceae bacterium]